MNMMKNINEFYVTNDVNEMYYDVTKMYVDAYSNDYATFAYVVDMLNDVAKKLMHDIIDNDARNYIIIVNDEYTSYTIIFDYDYRFTCIEYMLNDDDDIMLFNTCVFDDIIEIIENVFDNHASIFDLNLLFNRTNESMM